MLPETTGKWNRESHANQMRAARTNRPVMAKSGTHERLFARCVLLTATLFLACVLNARADHGAPATATVYGAQVAAIAEENALLRQIGRPGQSQ